METTDPSYNFTHRRYNHGRIYVTDEHHANTTDDNYDTFNLNQYYNAIEDEQLYMDEYTSLVHRYNEFIVNSNTLFLRMEQTLRENIARAVARQSYHYHESDYLHRRLSQRVLPRRVSRQDVAPTGVLSNTASTLPSNPTPLQRYSDMIPRLLTRYISTENAREERNRNNNNNNNFMLYTFPINAVVGNTGQAGSSVNNAPTNEQINHATLNTVFSHILSPINTTCPISRDEFNDESEITMIRGCNHIFNRGSLREWFTRHSTCPMCRRDIRDYRPSQLRNIPLASLGSSLPPYDIPRNISIDSVERDQLTFSYDLPSNVNNDEIYRNVINTITNMLNDAPNDASNDASNDAMEMD